MDIVTFLENFQFRNEFWILILPVSLMAIDIRRLSAGSGNTRYDLVYFDCVYGVL